MVANNIVPEIYWTIMATVNDGKLDDLKAVVEKTSSATRTEAGALSYG